MEAVGQLAAGVAHDFNNVATVIIGFSELALERLEDGHPGRPDLEQVITAGRSAASLTRQLLAFSRRQALRPEILDLNTVVAGMELLLRRTIGEDVRFALRLAPAVDRVSADRSQIEQVVMNLVVNARDAMPGGGSLTIETANVRLDRAHVETHPGASVGPHVSIAITDTGKGMPEHVRSHLFEPFFTTKGPGKGTGLGLATVYGIVQQSGGSIVVDTAVGQGTTFTIYIPRTEQAGADSLAPAKTGPVTGGTETILLAEDEPGVRAMIRATLERHGYTVLEASSGADALSIMGLHPGTIDLLFTDVVMPGMNGRELARRVVDERPGTRVLFATGFGGDAIIRHGVIDASLDLIEKPFSPPALLRKVREVLDAIS
jgi:CheY-like chemotaxis protein